MTLKKDLTNVQHLFDQHIQNTQIGFTTIIRNHLVAASRLQKSQLEIILEEMEDITSSCPVMEVLSHQRYQSATVANIQKEAKWSCQLANRKLQFLTKNIKRNKQPATSPPAPAPAPAPAATLPVVLPPIAVQPKLPQPENTPPPPQAVTTTSTPRPTTARVPPPDEHHRSWTGDPLPPAQELEIQLNARTEVAEAIASATTVLSITPASVIHQAKARADPELKKKIPIPFYGTFFGPSPPPGYSIRPVNRPKPPGWIYPPKNSNWSSWLKKWAGEPTEDTNTTTATTGYIRATRSSTKTTTDPTKAQASPPSEQENVSSNTSIAAPEELTTSIPDTPPETLKLRLPTPGSIYRSTNRPATISFTEHPDRRVTRAMRRADIRTLLQQQDPPWLPDCNS